MHRCAAGSRKEKSAGGGENGSAEKNYFIQQRIYGIALLILTIAVCAFMRDATIAVITVPLGLTLIVSKRMWLINEYYWNTKERKTLRR